MTRNCVIMYVALIFVIAATGAYETKYDNVNLDEILGNKRLLTNYIRCVLSEGPCTPEGQELKDVLPDALHSECALCTERQKQGAEKVIHFIIERRPSDWKRLSKVYDADGSYYNKYLEAKNYQYQYK